jgi:hypothetical protein
MVRSVAQRHVSNHEVADSTASSFETLAFGSLLRMRSYIARPNGPRMNLPHAKGDTAKGELCDLG